jgi:hypothetical protein
MRAMGTLPCSKGHSLIIAVSRREPRSRRAMQRMGEIIFTSEWMVLMLLLVVVVVVAGSFTAVMVEMGLRCRGELNLTIRGALRCGAGG